MCTTTFLQLSNENIEYFPCAHFSLPIHKQIVLVTDPHYIGQSCQQLYLHIIVF